MHSYKVESAVPYVRFGVGSICWAEFAKQIAVASTFSRVAPSTRMPKVRTTRGCHISSQDKKFNSL